MKYEELIKLIKTATSIEEIDSRRDDIVALIPQISRMFNYNQKNHAHQYDLWMHCLHTVLNLDRNMDDDMLYLAALIHDIGKTNCQVAGTREDDKDMHYYGHPECSAEIVENEILPFLCKNGIRLSSEDKMQLVYFVRYHDDSVSLRIKHLRRHLKIASLGDFKKLMLLQVADAKAHVMLPTVEERIMVCEKLSGKYADYLYEQILAEK